jgi:uncharacterized protein (TIGR00369 family)
MIPLPQLGSNFVSNRNINDGIGVQWYINDDKNIIGEVTLSDRQEGPPLHAHGGASAAMLDEAMGTAAWNAGHMVVAVDLHVTYKHPVPLGQKVQIHGLVDHKEGRKIFTAGEILLEDGTIAATSTGVFVEAPEMFEQYAEQYQRLLNQKQDEGNNK